MKQSPFRIVAHALSVFALPVIVAGVLMTSPADSSADWSRYNQYKKSKTKVNASDVFAALKTIKTEVGVCNEQLASLQSDIDGLRNAKLPD